MVEEDDDVGYEGEEDDANHGEAPHLYSCQPWIGGTDNQEFDLLLINNEVDYGCYNVIKYLRLH